MEAKNYDSLIEVFRGDLWEAEVDKGLIKVCRCGCHAKR